MATRAAAASPRQLHLDANKMTTDDGTWIQGATRQPALPPCTEAVPLLRVQGVSVHFGGIVALDAVSFDVEPGRICGLIGPNGAGKSTLFNCLSRLYSWSGGTYCSTASGWPKSRVTALPPWASAALSRTWRCFAP